MINSRTGYPHSRRCLLGAFLPTVLDNAVLKLSITYNSHRLAAFTWWYEFYYDAVQSGQYVFKIQELHKQYGPIIRVTPDEVHINDVGYLDTIYAPSMTRLDKYDYQLRTLRVPGGVGTTADYYLHRIRREALPPFFSKRNVLWLESVITEKDAFYGFSNDVVNNF
ncbi:hypothetical protein AFLA_007453 [Aspergillus flavus NRRL3357]|nr:hypothetical protein AFLA_007453 [Aspergillus flavus NRRL3357]